MKYITATKKIIEPKTVQDRKNLIVRNVESIISSIILRETPNGLRYLRWGRDGEAVQPEKWKGVENCLRLPQNPQRQVHALLARAPQYKYIMAAEVSQKILGLWWKLELEWILIYHFLNGGHI